tara:strand:+ start:1133 stop:2158 length:1026 start_codon:yes stop_codon:yes gene_type:complete
MTTTLSFATRDCVVIGCDSLATTIRPMIDPYNFINKFLDIDDKGTISLTKNEDGSETLTKISDIVNFIEDVPYNQQTNVTKIYKVNGTKVGVLFAGIAAIGEMSVKNIIDDFTEEKDISKYIKESSVTVHGIATRLRGFIKSLYDSSFKDLQYKPVMEIVVSGYSEKYNKPEIHKITFQNDGKVDINQSCKRGEYKIVFGGQYDIIERIVHGIDYNTFRNYTQLLHSILADYQNSIQEILNKEKVSINIPKAENIDSTSELIKERFWSGVGFSMANFSEQAAIDFVEFLVQVMIKSQQFSSQLPTVGGQIHMAIITKSGGFRWLSKEEYTFQNNTVNKYEK